MSDLPLPIDELVAAGASAALLVGYHAFLRYRTRANPGYTVQGMNARVRTNWVEGVMQESKDILAVQTLRNSTMAATFLASTSVILVMGVLNLLAKREALAPTVGPKLLVLLLDLFVGFFGFAMSVRGYSHVGYMLGLPGAIDRGLRPAQVAVHLNRAADYYSVGMRAFYFLVPLVFWLFGSYALVAATGGLVVFLYWNDRAPGDEGEPPPSGG